MKLKTILTALLTAVLLIAMTVLPGIAEGNTEAIQAQVSHVSVAAHPANDRYLSLNFDFTANGAEYTVFVTGIRGTASNDWAEKLAQAIAERFAQGKSLRIATRATGRADEYVESAIDLMDAEKQNRFAPPEWQSGETPAFKSDTELCWAASASNALELSGWARALTEMNPGVVEFNNEDDVFAYFADNFTDAGSLAIEGEKWLLNGTVKDEAVDRETGKVQFGAAHWLGAQLYKAQSGGLARDYCAATVTSMDYDTASEGAAHYATLTGLAQAADALEKGFGVSLGVEFVGSMGGHDVCLTGTIREKTAEGAGKVMAVFLADSDNDAADYDYADQEAAQKAGPRGERVNSFEMYPVATRIYGDNMNGVKVVGFWMHPETDTAITDIMTIRPFSADLPRETVGTKDVYASPDLVPTEIVVGENCCRYDQAKTGDAVLLRANISNQSYVRVTDEASAAMTIRYHIYRDGAEVDTVDRDVELTGERLLPMSSGRDGTEITYTFAEPGVYDIAVEIMSIRDANGEIREAYVQNNFLKYAKVTVTQP